MGQCDCTVCCPHGVSCRGRCAQCWIGLFEEPITLRPHDSLDPQAISVRPGAKRFLVNQQVVNVPKLTRVTINGEVVYNASVCCRDPAHHAPDCECATL